MPGGVRSYNIMLVGWLREQYQRLAVNKCPSEQRNNVEASKRYLCEIERITGAEIDCASEGNNTEKVDQSQRNASDSDSIFR